MCKDDQTYCHHSSPRQTCERSFETLVRSPNVDIIAKPPLSGEVSAVETILHGHNPQHLITKKVKHWEIEIRSNALEPESKDSCEEDGMNSSVFFKCGVGSAGSIVSFPRLLGVAGCDEKDKARSNAGSRDPDFVGLVMVELSESWPLPMLSSYPKLRSEAQACHAEELLFKHPKGIVSRDNHSRSHCKKHRR